MDVLLYLSLVAACVVAGMTYSRFTPGPCCGCIATQCGGIVDEYTITVSGMPPGDSWLEGTFVMTGTEGPSQYTWLSPPITPLAGNCIKGGSTVETVQYRTVLNKGDFDCCVYIVEVPIGAQSSGLGWAWSRGCPFPDGLTWANFSATATTIFSTPFVFPCATGYTPTLTVTATGSPF